MLSLVPMEPKERTLGNTVGVRLPRYIERVYQEESERDGISVASLVRRACMRDFAARFGGTTTKAEIRRKGHAARRNRK
jgi:hypothetical protein